MLHIDGEWFKDADGRIPAPLPGSRKKSLLTAKQGGGVMQFKGNPAITAPTTLFVPNLQYPNGYRVMVSDGRFTQDMTRQRLIYQQTVETPQHTIRLERIS